MAKVLFIYFDLHSGHSLSFQHGLASIFGTLRNSNHEVYLRHLSEETDFDSTINVLESGSYDILALSFTTTQKKYVRVFLDKLKPSSQRIIIAGGVHCTIVKDGVFEEYPMIDGICIGDGEFPLKEMCRRLDANEDILSTPSFNFKSRDKIIRNPIAPLPGIDELPLPDYSLFNCDKIISQLGLNYPMMLGRGCPYNCNYCCNHVIRQVYPEKNTYTRIPSVERSIKIIKNNLSLFAETKKIKFYDETFTLNRKWLLAFCGEYKKEIGLPFMCDTVFERIDDEIAQALKSAGCESINFGLETGNEWLRSHILNRKHSNKKIREVVKVIKRHQIKCFFFNLVGFPFETKEMAEETLRFNIELSPDFGTCHYFFPFPGTKLYKLCTDYGLLNENLGSVSGFFEEPSLKEVFMTHKEMNKYRESMNALFFMRLLFAKFKIPFLFEKIVLVIIFPFRKLINSLTLDPRTTNKAIIALRKIMIRLAWKYLR
jgi:anaerobic magnesium-protoporphyrin IX monomethyl ester cyclase